MVLENITQKTLEVIVKSTLTQEPSSWRLTLNGIYIWPAIVIAFVVLIVSLGLLARLKFELHQTRADIAAAQARRDKASEEMKAAEARWDEIRHTLSEHEKKAVDRALDRIDAGENIQRRFDKHAKEKLWDMVKNEVDGK